MVGRRTVVAIWYGGINPRVKRWQRRFEKDFEKQESWTVEVMVKWKRERKEKR